LTKKKKKTTIPSLYNSDPEVEQQRLRQRQRQQQQQQQQTPTIIPSATTCQDILSIGNNNNNNNKIKNKSNEKKSVTIGRKTTTTTTRNKNDIKKDDITKPHITYETISNKDANTFTRKNPLISVVSDNDADDATVVSSMQRQQPHRQQRRISGNESDDTRSTTKTTTTKSLISPLSLVSPFISVVGENHDDGNDRGTPLLTEVSVTRKPKGSKSEGNEGSHQISAWNVSLTETVHDNQTIEEKKITDGDEEENFGRKNILKFQQDLEGMFERQRRNKTTNKTQDEDDDNHNDGDDSQIILSIGSWTTERRQWLWTYMLQRRQQHDEIGDIFDVNRRIFSELFDAEYRHSHGNDVNNMNNNNNYSLESILRRVEVEKDRRLAFQAVLVIQEHYTYHQRNFVLLQNDENNDILKNNNNNSMKVINKEFVFGEELQQGMVQLIPLIVDIVMIPSNGRRTQMAQIAWETVILLMAFRIRYYCHCSHNKHDSSSSVLSPNNDDDGKSPIIIEDSNPSASSSSYNTAPLVPVASFLTSFWEQMRSLIQRQIMWQGSKKKTNEMKLNQLRELQTRFEKIMINKAVTDNNDLLNDDFTIMTSYHLMDLVAALEKQIKL